MGRWGRGIDAWEGVTADRQLTDGRTDGRIPGWCCAQSWSCAMPRILCAVSVSVLC